VGVARGRGKYCLEQANNNINNPTERRDMDADGDGSTGASRGIDPLDQDIESPVDSRLGKMFQRREMELQDELEQIKSLGKVSF